MVSVVTIGNHSFRKTRGANFTTKSPVQDTAASEHYYNIKQ